MFHYNRRVRRLCELIASTNKEEIDMAYTGMYID